MWIKEREGKRKTEYKKSDGGHHPRAQKLRQLDGRLVFSDRVRLKEKKRNTKRSQKIAVWSKRGPPCLNGGKGGSQRDEAVQKRPGRDKRTRPRTHKHDLAMNTRTYKRRPGE